MMKVSILIQIWPHLLFLTIQTKIKKIYLLIFKTNLRIKDINAKIKKKTPT